MIACVWSLLRCVGVRLHGFKPQFYLHAMWLGASVKNGNANHTYFLGILAGLSNSYTESSITEVLKKMQTAKFCKRAIKSD